MTTTLELSDDAEEALQQLERMAKGIANQYFEKKEARAKYNSMVMAAEQGAVEYEKTKEAEKAAAERDTSPDVEMSMQEMRQAKIDGALTRQQLDAAWNAIGAESDRQIKAEEQSQAVTDEADNLNYAAKVREAIAARDRGDMAESNRLYAEANK